jgi:hypothetical protein
VPADQLVPGGGEGQGDDRLREEVVKLVVDTVAVDVADGVPLEVDGVNPVSSRHSR